MVENRAEGVACVLFQRVGFTPSSGLGKVLVLRPVGVEVLLLLPFPLAGQHISHAYGEAQGE